MRAIEPNPFPPLAGEDWDGGRGLLVEEALVVRGREPGQLIEIDIAAR